jgi:hypothetical protein
MGWSIGFDTRLNRDIGYGVPAYCDHPECVARIDRGLSHVCGGEPFGGEDGCGLHFCGKHLSGYPQRCERCSARRAPFGKTPEHPAWIEWKLTDPSWQTWRDENPSEVATYRALLAAAQSTNAREVGGANPSSETQ